ncbi:ribonuclease H-like domain-containing protein [Tanacetum coccineum]
METKNRAILSSSRPCSMECHREWQLFQTNSTNNSKSDGSTNEVNTANVQVSIANSSVSTADSPDSTVNLSDAIVYTFLANQPNGSQLVHEDLKQIHEDDLEEMNLKWQLALLSMKAKGYFQRTGKKITINGSNTSGYDKNQDSSRRTVDVEETSSKATVTIDGALEFNKSEFNLATYKRGLASIEEQLVFYNKNEVMFCDQIAVLKRDTSFKDSEINALKNEIEKLKKEKESNQIKIDKFENASKSLDKLIGSQISNNSRKGVGYMFQKPKFEGYGPKASKSFCKGTSNEVKKTLDAPLGEKMVSEKEKQTVFPTKIEFAHCNYHQREGMVNVNNYTRVNYNYSAKKAHPNSHRNMTPKAVLIKIGLKPLNTTRPVNTAHPKTAVYRARPMSCFSKLAQSTIKRPYQSRTTLTNKNFNQKINTAKEKVYIAKPKAVNTAKPKAFNTARPTSAVVNAVKANQINAIKASACNMSYLTDFKEFDGGYVTFMRAKRNVITGKGTLKTGLHDESQVLLSNMYSVDMKNIVPKESLTCLVAKDTFNESMLWNRRLGHIYFKTINKLVKDNLVRGLLAKCFENDQTCVACLKGKQHKAYCDGLKWLFDIDSLTKLMNYVPVVAGLVLLSILSICGPPEKVGDEAVHKELGDIMERVVTTASSLEAEQDSGNIKLKGSDSGPRCQDTKLGGVDAQIRYKWSAYLLKLEGSEDFHHIVYFLNTSHIKYALTENPTIHVSLIQQFWQTASASTSKYGEMEIIPTKSTKTIDKKYRGDFTTIHLNNTTTNHFTATIDGRVKTITEASIRRHLKLEDSDGISTLPNTEIFKQLALIGTYIAPTLTHKLFSNMRKASKGYTGVDIPLFPTMLVQEEAATLPYDSPLLRVHSLRSDEGSITLHKLTALCITLSKKVESLESDLKQTKLTYGAAFTKLIMKVKRLEKEVKLNKARRRGKIVVSDYEDAEKDTSKQGRSMIEYIDQDERVSLVQINAEDQESAAKILADVAIVHTYSIRRMTVSTGSGGISTPKESVSTAGASMPVSTAGMDQGSIPSPSASKDKGKAIMIESEPKQATTKLKQRQEIAGYEAAIRLQEQLDEEESHRISRDAEVAQRLQEEIDASERQRMAQVHQAAQGFTDVEWDDILGLSCSR